MASLSSSTMFSSPRKAFAPSTTLPNFKQAALFELKPSAGGRVTCMASYNVKLITPEGEVSFECPDNAYIVDVAEEQGIDLPYSCRAGACSSCAGKVVSGGVDQSAQVFLYDEQIAEGWVLTCMASPTSDVVIETHKERDME